MIGLFRRPKKKVLKEFDAVMQTAAKLANRKNVEGLRDLQKIVLKPIQALHIRDAYLKPPHGGVESLFWNESLGIERHIPGLNQGLVDYVWSPKCLVRDKSVYPELRLSSDIVLPTSWHPTSIVQNLGRIGKGLSNGEFKQSTNHSVMYSYPLGIGWVANGNHSIIQAVLRGEGTVVPTEIHDMTDLLDLIMFDGSVWRSRDTGSVLGSPRYKEFGWVWEVGRMISTVERSPYRAVLKLEEELFVTEV